MTVEVPTDGVAERAFERLTPRARLLDAILALAVAHDKVCQSVDETVYAYYGITRGGEPIAFGNADDGPLSDLRYTTIELCAAVAEAAVRRLPAFEPFADELAGGGIVLGLRGAALDAFMRPIFEESGIGDRFEVRMRHEVRHARLLEQ